MRLVFAGTPEFACAALRRLRDAGHEVPLVWTQPDRPAGRGMQLQESPVKTYARGRGIAVAQPRSLRLEGRFAADAALVQQMLVDVRADIMVVAAYGLILPRWVLDTVRCINIHASLLPRWRGAAPIHRAIEAGDAETGVTIMQMDEGLDTGDMLLVQTCPIHHAGAAADTTGSLHDRLAVIGGDLVVQALELAQQGRLQARVQPQQGVTYAHKVEKSQAELSWPVDAALVERRVRAFNPAPGAWSVLGKDVLKIWRVELLDPEIPCKVAPGTVLAAGPLGIDVACGRGIVRVTELQKAGGKRLRVADFLRGFDLHAGMRFESAPLA